MCLYPKIIKNRKYVSNKKNKGVVPVAQDRRVLYVPVGCGKCMECRKQKSRNWQVRLHEEIKENRNGKFVTLSFSNEALNELEKEVKELTGYERDNEVATIAVRRYLERWRKKYKKSVKHWLVTELGQKKTERIHIHGIMWTDEKEDIEKIWKYGNVWVGEFVNGKTINYIVKYVNKVDSLHKEYKSKILTSKGIGSGYINGINVKNNKYKEKGTNERYTTRSGIKMALPIYYRNKIYSEAEREKLWLEKLDEETRYVNGVKVDISKGEEEYHKTVEYYRVLNKRLGYGDNEINWERKRYENERRNLKKMERLKESNKKELP
jgi:protein required for attachment to host cells